MADLFKEGDPAEMAQMLVDVYPPADIGLVLTGLTPDRVQALLQGIRSAAPDILMGVEASYRAEMTK
jgi:hypothetical protein